MRDYELMCVLNPELNEAGLEAQNERLTTMVTGRGGEVVSMEPWGRRRLAYQVKNYREGIFILTRFKMAPADAETLERTLQLNEAVIRHLIVRPPDSN